MTIFSRLFGATGVADARLDRLYECHECGSVVANRERHEAWHDAQFSDRRRLDEAISNVDGRVGGLEGL